MDALFGYLRGGSTWAMVAVVAAFALSGCGGSSGGDGASEVARQDELRAARAQAAQNARQSARIATLERKLTHASRKRTESTTAPAAAPAPTAEPAAAPPSSDAAPLEGLWKGGAVIAYDDGSSDPFEQTIHIDSLVPGQVSGSSEAVQGTTTCHGPVVFQGISEGWYRFSSEEQNKAECIDSSVVELLPVSAGVVEYRETTETSQSTGTLQRVD